MFISFYLTAELFQERNDVVLKKRIKRLLYPLIFWTLVYYIILSIISGSFLDWKHIFYSILFGSSSILVPPLWFISAQILIVFLFFIVSCLIRDNKKMQIACIIIIVISFVFQYKGINYYLFGSAVFESKWTLGRIVEVLPISATGILYALNEQKIKHRGLMVLLLLAVVFVSKGFMQPEGFQYSGICIYFRALLVCFFCINFPEIKCKRLVCTINYIAQYTMGVYCLHYLVGKYIWLILEFLHINLNVQSLLYNILIYISSFLISVIIDFGTYKVKGLKVLGDFVK